MMMMIRGIKLSLAKLILTQINFAYKVYVEILDMSFDKNCNKYDIHYNIKYKVWQYIIYSRVIYYDLNFYDSSYGL